jgi:hypothetical protein
MEQFKFDRRLIMTDMDNDLYRKENLIQKRSIPVAVQTTKQLIRGNFHVRGVMRIIEELGFEETFIAITDAEIYAYKGDRLFKTGFVAVNRKEIVWMAPEEDIVAKEGDDPG